MESVAKFVKGRRLLCHRWNNAFVRSMYGAIQLNPFCEATLTRGHSLWKGHSTMSTPDERPSLLKVHFSCAKGVASLEGFNCNILLTP